ncbi:MULTISPECIES: copper homeostasis protein CutC [Bacillus cereus group]|uniref:PF03932 family protein CutC n=1 Tax=Bacillus mycoides TaxID=1405 RepID=A0A1W6AA98_BACMY|nr:MULTISPECIES: copper homeostasis protein CutC [Bacillus cereus group]MBT2579606.1 copper homeostasis protein CutC [Bacillus sp. ISL-8]ARJ22701.1 copper homeostasis protein CutC [Bacillus mycoides]EOO20382.1 copper homeostasis protein cutC [Bacillus cereus HuA2-9]MCZ6944293.1 copper homeostasis protein CutC [Bacillus mycoides]QWH29336.1 copper homeostasis protein CutC [Bacillus mycoides]
MLEVIATCLEDVKRIEKAGGNRIELISSYTEGGLTPSYAFIKKAVDAVQIPVHVMIRPHAKSFTYTEEEIEMMKEDIVVAQNLGAAGVVLGVLNVQNEVDEEKLADILSVVDGINVTYHRAIDDTENPVEAMKALKKFNKVTHVLTSGGQGNVVDNIPVLREMQKESEGNIQLVVGSGVTKENVKQLLDETGISQAHVGTAVREGKSCFSEIDPNLVQELVQIIK